MLQQVPAGFISKNFHCNERLMQQIGQCLLCIVEGNVKPFQFRCVGSVKDFFHFYLIGMCYFIVEPVFRQSKSFQNPAIHFAFNNDRKCNVARAVLRFYMESVPFASTTANLTSSILKTSFSLSIIKILSIG